MTENPAGSARQGVLYPIHANEFQDVLTALSVTESESLT